MFRIRVPLLALAVGAAALAGCGSDDEPTKPLASCQGSARLCNVRLDQVIFPGTHNSFAASDRPGWHFADQTHDIARQLEDGIRALLLDVHFGVDDPRVGRVRTDLRAEGADRNKVVQQVGPRALALADRLGGRVGAGRLPGPSKPFLCHTLCELGAEPLDQELGVIGRFLDEHPDQVLIVIVEDYVLPKVIEEAFERAALLDSVATLDRGEPLPTLGSLIRSGRRLVVFAEDDGGKPSWYMPAFTFIQDTPLGERRPSRLSCALYRGDPDNPILMLNHWLAVFPPAPALERQIGRAAFLYRRIAQCTRERGRAPGIVAVDFYEQTAVVKVARNLNAVTAAAR